MVAGALFAAAFIVISIRVVDVSIFSSEAEPRYSRSITKPKNIPDVQTSTATAFLWQPA